MKTQTGDLHNYCRQSDLAGAGLRSGMAKDKLIFIVICSAATAVAVVSLMSQFLPHRGAPSLQSWQCLKCEQIFESRTQQLPPIDCPECGGEAVSLRWRKCPACGKKAPMCRVRLTQGGRAQYAQVLANSPKGGGVPGPMERGPMSMLPSEIQYLQKQSDGKFGWSPWLRMESPRTQQFRRNWECPECGGR